MNKNPGCLSGLLKLFFVNKIFDWAQRNFGFGRGGCCGCGCGVILFVISVGVVCSILTGTDWLHFSF